MTKGKETERASTTAPTPPQESLSSRSQSGIRRTERVKRDKPDFYNASEFNKQRKVICVLHSAFHSFQLVHFV